MNYNTLKQTLDRLEADGISMPSMEETMDSLGSEDVIQGYLDRIGELEQENRSLKDLKAISEDFMKRTSTGGSAQRSSMQFRRTSYVQIPELDEVDEALENEQMAAAEEEAFRWIPFYQQKTSVF